MPSAFRNTDQKISGPGSAITGCTEAVRSLVHDIRTPLTSLKSCLNLVLNGEAGDLTADQRRFLGMARRNIHRLDSMVEDMLAASRPSTRPDLTRRCEVDLGPILREAVGLHMVTARSRGLEIDEAGLPDSFTARVDPDLVIRMLDNVLGNALKFTEPGGRVKVSLESRGGYPHTLAGRLARHCGLPLADFTLIVKDSGPGLGPEVENRLFEPFNRGKSCAGPGARGSGLGLSITRRLAESHGGHVRLMSLPGRGTTVWITLPRDPASEHFQHTVDQLAAALKAGSGDGVQPLVGILDLRPSDGRDLSAGLNLEEFFGRGPSGSTEYWSPVPGLRVAAVLDPLNWSRRWTLFASRTGGGLEATRWEYLAGQTPEESTVTGSSGKQLETMVNPAPIGPNNW